MQNKIKNFSKFIQIIDDFFVNKEYNNTGFLKKLQNRLKVKTNQNLEIKRLASFLTSYHKFNLINKFTDLKDNFYKETSVLTGQKGGFFSNKYDNKYTKTLNVIDFLFDIINLIPSKIITSNYNYITLPYGIISFIVNLIRGDNDFAFYSFLGLFPGLGGLLGSSLKLIHRIIRFMINKSKVYKYENYYKQIQGARRVHDFIKDEKYEKIKNPFLGEFEENYNMKNIEELYLK